jgi:hypothetical protein
LDGRIFAGRPHPPGPLAYLEIVPARLSRLSQILSLRPHFLVLFFFRHDFHRDEANYHDDLYVDYLD